MSSAAVDACAPPAFCSAPTAVDDDVDLVDDFCAAFGLPMPDEPQRLALATTSGRDAAGCLVAREAAIIEPRQNGKTFGLELSKLARAYVLAVPLTIWSAHKFKSTRETHRRLRNYILGLDPLAQADPDVAARRQFLAAEVLRMPEANGEELIELRNGARILFLARSTGSGRAFSADDLVLDEAFALTEDMVADIVPTMAARESGQTLYVSSHPHPSSTVLRAIRDRGRAGDPDLAYVEYRSSRRCASAACEHEVGTDGCALDDLEAVRDANPAFGSRITQETVRTERKAMASRPLTFARERLGWDDDPVETVSDLSVARWLELATDAAPSGALTFGVDVAPGHVRSAIYVFGSGILPIGELVDSRSGSAWLPVRLAQLVEDHRGSAVALDPSGPVGSMLADLERAGLPLAPIEGRDAVRSCGAFTRAVTLGLFRHRGESALEVAVVGARTRRSGDGARWSRRDSTVDISPLVAASCAWWVASTGVAPDYDIASSIY